MVFAPGYREKQSGPWPMSGRYLCGTSWSMLSPCLPTELCYSSIGTLVRVHLWKQMSLHPAHKPTVFHPFIAPYAGPCSLIGALGSSVQSVCDRRCAILFRCWFFWSWRFYRLRRLSSHVGLGGGSRRAWLGHSSTSSTLSPSTTTYTASDSYPNHTYSHAQNSWSQRTRHAICMTFFWWVMVCKCFLCRCVGVYGRRLLVRSWGGVCCLLFVGLVLLRLDVAHGWSRCPLRSLLCWCSYHLHQLGTETLTSACCY